MPARAEANSARLPGDDGKAVGVEPPVGEGETVGVIDGFIEAPRIGSPEADRPLHRRQIERPCAIDVAVKRPPSDARRMAPLRS